MLETIRLDRILKGERERERGGKRKVEVAFLKRLFKRNMAELFYDGTSHAILQNRPIRYSELKRNYTMLIDETWFLKRLKPL